MDLFQKIMRERINKELVEYTKTAEFANLIKKSLRINVKEMLEGSNIEDFLSRDGSKKFYATIEEYILKRLKV
jgi:dissimilatory sulfite reductase (desulfoviridin) alpha/beta subunit